MDIIALDFETFFDKDYTLKKLTTEAYIRDERFEALCLGVRDAKGNYFCLKPNEIEPWLAGIDWSKTAILAHHAHFDGLILSHHYGVVPVQWFDTLSMARLMLGNHLSVALASLADHYGLEAKNVPYNDFVGCRWQELSPLIRQTLTDGCVHDVKLTWSIFEKLAQGFPVTEYAIIDMTVRLFTEPTIRGDIKLFEKVRDEEWTRKNEILYSLGVNSKDLASANKFAELLENEGVELEYKNGKNGPIPAVAATDDFMKGLVDHENPRVAGLANARLEVRSTIDETRAGRLAGMASRGAMPVYLGYCAAHTTRWAGGDRVNFQNFPRGGELRKGLMAPQNYFLAVIDLSQIECRILNYVAGQHDIIQAFRENRDLYSEGASRFYGKTINKKDNPTERHLGKVLELGCGYGMGAERLRVTCKAGALGGPSILLDVSEANAAIKAYRDAHQKVVGYWKQGDNMLTHLAQGEGAVEWGPLTVEKGKIILPNAAPIHYRLEYDLEERQWRRKTRRGWVKIWGGHLAENVVQAMARVVMSDAMLRIRRRGYRIVLTTHDEIVVLIPQQDAQQHYDYLLQEMKATPNWLEGIPLDAEGMFAERYEK
jgi:DNA polymerase family A